MSHSVYGEIIDRRVLASVLGSNSQTHLQTITGMADFDARAEDIDELADPARGVPTCRQALADLIAGKAVPRKHSYVYVYALELMCRAFGRRTIMGPWFERVGADALARLDDGLRACGLAAVTPLVSGVAIPASATFPLAIPTQTEWPFVTVHAHEGNYQYLQTFEQHVGKLKPNVVGGALQVYALLRQMMNTDVLVLFHY